MERSLVSVLTFVTLVTATPHGYGVKGGASAKAEASAVAGNFGDLGPLPLSIPAGSGYSGSFSKSSSSSFASSSASSSSSSYSFSGSGANGIGADKRCSSGTCPGVGASGPSLNGAQQFSGANVISAAQAKAQSGSITPCQEPNCNGSPAEKCASGQCPSDSALKSENSCIENGNCQSPSSGSNIPIEDSADKDGKHKQEETLGDSNDFAVNINRNQQSKQSHDASGQYANKETSYNPESGCSNGKCGPGSSDQTSFGSNQNKHPTPSIYLTTPNKTPPCSTPNCNYPAPNSGSQTGNLPSSYNVPIQSATNPPNTYYSSPSGHTSLPNPENSVSSGLPCTLPSCSSTPYNVGTSNIPNYHYKQQGSCASGQCDIPSTSVGKTNNVALSGIKVPNYSYGSIPSNVPSGHSRQPGCSAPYCSGFPTHSSLPTTNQLDISCNGAACSGTSLPSLSTKPDSNAPVYTGGFGGPAGFLDINSGNNKSPGNGHNYSHNKPAISTPAGALVSSPTLGTFGTTNPNELNSNNNYGSTQTSSSGGSTGTFEYNKPSNRPSIPNSQFNPSATGSFGAPTAPAFIPLGSPQQNGMYKPITSSTGSSPTYSGGIDGSTALTHTSSGSNSIQGTFGVTKPNTLSHSVSSPAYTGGFGGPSGIVDGASPSVVPTSSFNKPGSGNCGSTNCQSDTNGNGGSPSHDNPSPRPSTSSQNKPLYSGGFGGPTGFLNPNVHNVPSNTPTTSSGNIPCVNGNCDSKGNLPPSPGSSTTSTHSLAAATASANAVAYSGGFGGPPGVLKPYDDGKINIPAQGNLANGLTISSNNGPSNIPSDTEKNSGPGNSENGANSAAHAKAVASATAGGYASNNYQNNNGASRGCNSGCSSNGAVDDHFGLPHGLSSDGLSSSSLASAKSVAGTNAYGNFASSSASAHASAGAATKGGYGRK